MTRPSAKPDIQSKLLANTKKRRSAPNPEILALQKQLGNLLMLAPEELIDSLDLHQAGIDFERLVNCINVVDCQSDIDIELRARNIADDYSAWAHNRAASGQSDDHLSMHPDLDPAGINVIEIGGTIKWFDADKGYGFILPDDGSSDILLHVTCLRAGGFQTAYEGARIHCQVLVRPRGQQAFRIISMDTSTAHHPSTLPHRTHTVVEPTSDWERAMVKWFNGVRGIGFLTRGKDTPDIFVPMETLRRFGFTELKVGDYIDVRYGHGPRGFTAAELRTSGDGVIPDRV